MNREQLIRRSHREGGPQGAFIVIEVYTDDPKLTLPQWELWGEWRAEDLERVEDTLLILLGDPPPPASTHPWQLHYKTWENTSFVAKRKNWEHRSYPQGNTLEEFLQALTSHYRINTR